MGSAEDSPRKEEVDGSGSKEEGKNDGEAELKKSEGFREIWERWPMQTFFIFGNEFCERFSYYGMRTVLTLYFMTILRFDGDQATVWYHLFVFVCYCSPIAGSIIADGYIGKYLTILYISCLYAVGQSLLAVAAIFPAGSSLHPFLDLLSIMLVGLGTGGIKPCVPAFGADQFPQEEKEMISMFFSVFYVAINCGSLISTFITPILRVQSCFGAETCFSLAFGVPAVLMILATVLFVVGTPCYVRNPPKENIIALVCKEIWNALRNRWSATEKRDHWMDYALEGHECQDSERCCRDGGEDPLFCPKEKLVEDIKGVIRVLVLMLPIPVFFALYDQQGSRWILQAVSMDGRITSGFTLYPDQMNVFNPLLVIILVPIFQTIIYPKLERMGWNPTLLQRMGLGGYVAAVSFVVCGIVQLYVDATLPETPNSTHAFVSVINAFPNSSCEFSISLQGHGEQILPGNSSLMDDKAKGVIRTFRIGEHLSDNKVFIILSKDPQCPSDSKISERLEAGKSYLLVLTPAGWTFFSHEHKKDNKALGQFSLSVIHIIPCDKWMVKSTDCASSEAFAPPVALCSRSDSTCTTTNKNFFTWSSSEATKISVRKYSNGDHAFSAALFHPKQISAGTYDIQYLVPTSTDNSTDLSKMKKVPLNGISFTKDKIGGQYAITLTGEDTDYEKITWNIHMIAPDNTVSILWQLPAYVLITIAEILLIVSGLELAYREASKAMKSVVQSIWLLTMSIGNIIILVVAEVHFAGLAVELFAFGIAMAVIMTIFVLIASFYYTYRETDADASLNEFPSDEKMSQSLSHSS